MARSSDRLAVRPEITNVSPMRIEWRKCRYNQWSCLDTCAIIPRMSAGELVAHRGDATHDAEHRFVSVQPPGEFLHWRGDVIIIAWHCTPRFPRLSQCQVGRFPGPES